MARPRAFGGALDARRSDARVGGPLARRREPDRRRLDLVRDHRLPADRRRPGRHVGVGAHDRRRHRQPDLYKIIKRWIARPRPYRTCPGIRACGRSLDEFSFPSGHTLHSVAFSLILTVYYPMFALFVWPLTILIAVSRIVLGLHYPSDVIVGAAIGAITAAVSFNLL